MRVFPASRRTLSAHVLWFACMFVTFSVNIGGPDCGTGIELMDNQSGVDLDPAIGAFEVETPKGMMPFQEFLASDASTTMSVLVLHRGDIVFDAVDFWYESDNPVLTDFSLEIKRGETIALVGPTGGGKTTITSEGKLV